MKHALVIIIALFAIVFVTFGQTKAELEEQRKRTLNEISYVDNLLKTTSKEKTESLNSLKIIGRKLTLREEVIKGMKEEGSMLEQRISLNKTAIELMEMDLKDLKDDYALAVLNSYKSHKMNSELIYVLSARDFNQGYKRLKYLKQAAKFRRNEAEIISEIKSQIEQSKADLEKDLLNISELKSREVTARCAPGVTTPTASWATAPPPSDSVRYRFRT
jgi:hypothetical protein